MRSTVESKRTTLPSLKGKQGNGRSHKMSIQQHEQTIENLRMKQSQKSYNKNNYHSSIMTMLHDYELNLVGDKFMKDTAKSDEIEGEQPKDDLQNRRKRELHQQTAESDAFLNKYKYEKF